MTLADAYKDQYKLCLKKGIRAESGHYQTHIDFKGKRVYVSPDGADVVRYKFDIRGCIKKRKITMRNGEIKIIKYHKDRLPVYGTITRQKRFKKFIYKYLLFLRCDGIENRDLMKLYLLHCLRYKFEFWRKDRVKYEKWELYDPKYQYIEKMINGLINSAMKKEIDDKTREQFIVRHCCVVNPEVMDKYGGIRNKTNREKRKDVKTGERIATDNRIKALYDPELKDVDNAKRINISLRRLQEWKADNKDSLESLEQKITRLYDSSLSIRKNAEIIGCSVNSIRKYKNELNDMTVDNNETDDAWVDSILEEESMFWKDVPEPKRKKDDDWEEMERLFKDIDIDIE